MRTMSAAALGPIALSLPIHCAPSPCAGASGAYRFFDCAEAQFIEAACERLIPADASGAGALGAGVPGYLDEHLSGSWGAGERLYRDGAWQAGSPLRLRLSMTPAALFRTALAAINRDLARHGTVFSRLSEAAQDRFLAALESDQVQLDGVPASGFFAALLGMTVEGYFSNPLHGMTRDRIAWRIHGFPGAHGTAS
jgi:gluconate 2-dehydrogenase gamma chain